MPKSPKPIYPSEFDGNFIKEVEPIIRNNNKKERMVQLSCVVCGKIFTVGYSNSKRTRQKACSNQCGGILTRNSKDFVAQQHPLYKVWTSLRDRCRNPNNKRYARYGERGIAFSTSFDTFNGFLAYVSKLNNFPYSNTEKLLKKVSIDRINNDMGYVEGNLRWADEYIQASNKTWKKPNSTSKYIGVVYCKTNKAWIAKLQTKNKLHHLYYGSSEEEAHLARKQFIIENNLPHTY